MRNKKHYNSYHPKLGFFLHIDEVLSWFDAEPSYYSSVRLIVPRVLSLETAYAVLIRQLIISLDV
jgi:hypothetical protein